MTDLLERCVFLFGRQRSGTTVLRRALASHPDVIDLGEIMHPEHASGFYKVLQDRLHNDASSGVHSHWFDILAETLKNLTKNDHSSRRYVVDIKYNMAAAFGTIFLNGSPVNALIHEIKARNLKAVQLIRRNKLHLIVSERVAIKTNQWELSEKKRKTKDATVFISPVTLGLKIQKEAAQDKYFLEQLGHVDKKILLVYEELFNEEGHFEIEPIEKFANLMGISSNFDLQPQLQKQRRKMSETIENFPSVERAIQVLIKEGYIPPFYLDTLD